MFEDLGMIERWKIPKEVLVRWVPCDLLDPLVV